MDRPSAGGFKLLNVVLAMLVAAIGGLAAELGQKAAPLKVEKWVVGQPVEVGEGKGTNLVVLTFFESWCDSCMAALPQLARIQARVKERGVKFVGISVEPAETIKSFAESAKVGPWLNFALGADREHATWDGYMMAYDRKKVPCSFVVNPEGTVVWEGPPLAGLEQALDQLLAGTYDMKAAKKVIATEKLLDEYFSVVTQTQDSSYKILSIGTPEELGRRILAEGVSAPWLLNNFAWRILTDQEIKKRDLPLAVRASKAACDADKTSNPSFLDTYARALFLSGRLAEAVEAQKRAVESCSDPAHRVRLERTLQGYQGTAQSQSKP